MVLVKSRLVLKVDLQLLYQFWSKSNARRDGEELGGCLFFAA